MIRSKRSSIVISMATTIAAMSLSATVSANPILNFELITQSDPTATRTPIALKTLDAEIWSAESGTFKFCPNVDGVPKSIVGPNCIYKVRAGGEVESRSIPAVTAQELLNLTYGAEAAFLRGYAPSSTGKGVAINYTSTPGGPPFNDGYLSVHAFKETPDGFALCPPEIQDKVIRSIGDGSCVYAYRLGNKIMESEAKLITSQEFLSKELGDSRHDVVGLAVQAGISTSIGLRHFGTYPPTLVVYYSLRPAGSGQDKTNR